MKVTVKWYWHIDSWVWAQKRYRDYKDDIRYDLDFGPLMITVRK